MKSIYIIDILLQNQMSKYLKREGVDFRTTKFKDLDQKVILSCIKKVDYLKHSIVNIIWFIHKNIDL